MLRGIEKAERDAARGNRGARLFVGSFDPGELGEVKATLRDVAKDLPRIRPASGTPVGSSQRVYQGAVGRIASGAAAQVLGHQIGTDAGWAMGVFAPELISQAMMSRPGRAAVRAAMKIDPQAGPLFRNTVAAVLRTQASIAKGEQPEELVAPRPKPAPTPAEAKPPPTPEQLRAANPTPTPEEQAEAVSR